VWHPNRSDEGRTSPIEANVEGLSERHLNTCQLRLEPRRSALSPGEAMDAAVSLSNDRITTRSLGLQRGSTIQPQGA
jgi:hypothetical protein